MVSNDSGPLGVRVDTTWIYTKLQNWNIKLKEIVYDYHPLYHINYNRGNAVTIQYDDTVVVAMYLCCINTTTPYF